MRRFITLDMAAFGVIAVGVLAFGLTSSNIYYLQVASSAGILATAAIGLNLAVGGAGQISVGHAGFMAIGAYTSAKLLTNDVPFILAFPIAGLAAVPFGIAVGYSALRLRGHYLAFATLAFGGIVYGLLLQLDYFGGARGIRLIPDYNFLGLEADGPRSQFFVIWGVALVGYLTALSLLRSRVGRALAAIRDDETAAATLGVNVAGLKVMIFAVSAVFAAFAGALLASYQSAIVPARFDILASITLLVMVAVGGVGSIPGSVIGAVALTVLPEFGREWERYRLTGYGALVIALMIFAPGGLMSIVTDFPLYAGRLAHFAKRILERLDRRGPAEVS